MKKGFTLIELLVVIVIIAILASVLMPVFVKARERARRTECVSDLRQIGAAISTYLNDWNDVYPNAWENTSVSDRGARPALPEVMTGYVTDQRVWRCPSDTGEIFLTSLDGPHSYMRHTPPFYSDQWASTSYEYFGKGYYDNLGKLGGRPLSVVKRPSVAILSFECRPWHDPRGAVPGSNENSTGLQNVLHCDGHVDTRTETQWFQDAIQGLKG